MDLSPAPACAESLPAATWLPTQMVFGFPMVPPAVGDHAALGVDEGERERARRSPAIAAAYAGSDCFACTPNVTRASSAAIRRPFRATQRSLSVRSSTSTTAEQAAHPPAV